MVFRLLLSLFALILFSGPAFTSSADSLGRLLPATTGAKRAGILNEIAREIRSKNSDSARILSEEALQLAKQHWDQPQIAESYSNLGVVAYYKGDFRKAAGHFREALLIFRLLHDFPKEADMFNNLGVMHRNLGDLSKALDYYLKALQIKEKHTNPTDRVGTLNNIGGIYYHQKNYSKASDYYNKVLAVAQEVNDEDLLAAAYNNLSLVAVDQGNYPVAENYAAKALEIRKRQEDTYNSAVVLSNLGRIKMLKGEPEEAVKYYLQSAERYKTNSDDNSYANTMMYVGNAYYHAGRPDVASNFLSSAYQIAEKLNNPALTRDISFNYAIVLHKLGKSAEAFPLLEHYTFLHDSLLNDESIRQMAEMEGLYQSSEKEKQIELLRQQNQINILDNERKKELLRRQAILQYSLIGGLSLILIIAALIFRGFRQKQKINRDLEAKNSAITRKNEEIQQKSNELGIKNKEITDSIRYAQRIQQAMLPREDMIQSLFPEYFVFFRPKDIVSGDFYWAGSRGDEVLIAAADCTGHGVPGAFMSIVGRNLLNQAVNEHGLTQPASILNELNRNLSETLQQNNGNAVRDGMDIALCTWNRRKQTVEFAGAFNPLYLIRRGELMMFKGNKFPVGNYTETKSSFSGFEIPVEEGDCFYLFSDGFADQFGGPSGKKFKYSQLRNLLLEIHTLPMSEQHKLLDERFNGWKGDMEQVDDVLITGFKIRTTES